MLFREVATDQPLTEGQRWIELLIPGSDTHLALFTPEGHQNRIGGFQPVTFWCDDVFATAKLLKSKGVELAAEPRKEPLPEGVAVSDVMGGTHQFVQFFAVRKSEIRKSAPALLKHAASGALVWISYPKKTSGVASDLSREEVWDAMSGTGWRAVSAVSIDDVWSALRFRPLEDVKSKSKR